MNGSHPPVGIAQILKHRGNIRKPEFDSEPLKSKKVSQGLLIFV